LVGVKRGRERHQKGSKPPGPALTKKKKRGIKGGKDKIRAGDASGNFTKQGKLQQIKACEKNTKPCLGTFETGESECWGLRGKESWRWVLE